MLKKNSKPIAKKERFSSSGTVKSLRPLHIAEDLSWDFGEDVMVYDVREKTPYVSYYIVASASGDRRLKALVATAEQALYDNFKDIHHTEGRNDSTWYLIDAGDVVVQLFTRTERDNVNFDALYEKCPHVLVKALKEPSYRRRKKKASQQNKDE